MAADGRVLHWEQLGGDAISVMAVVAGKNWLPGPMTLTSKRSLTDGCLRSAQTAIRHVRRRVADWMAMWNRIRLIVITDPESGNGCAWSGSERFIRTR